MTNQRTKPQRPAIRTRVLPADEERFDQMARDLNLSRASLLREAMLYYMDAFEQGQLNQIEKVYAEQLAKSTNRICSLLAKMGVDVRTIYRVLATDAAETFEEQRSLASKQIVSALTPEEKAAMDAMARNVKQQPEQ